jgi:hypothetical protein
MGDSRRLLRMRRSTVLLTAFFVITFAVWLLVRPAPPAASPGGHAPARPRPAPTVTGRAAGLARSPARQDDRAR